MAESINPGFSQNEPGEASNPRSFEAFKLIMEAEFQARKERSATSRERLSMERIAIKTIACKEEGSASKDPGVKKHTPTLSHPFVVFLALDVVKAKHGPKTVSEIGISTLDTNDLNEQLPEEAVAAWTRKIRTRNFRIKGSSKLEETDFVMAYGDNFKREFGKSEWISIHEAPKVIASCFGHPSPAPGAHLDDPAKALSSDLTAKSNIILVCHDVKAKIGHLRGIIGFDVTRLSNVLETVDTIDIFRALQQDLKSRSFHSLLQALRMPVSNQQYHPGNDSVYILQAMIQICSKSLDTKQQEQMAKSWVTRMEEKVRDSEDKISEQIEEWDLAEDNGESDGGEPVPLSKFFNKV